jgi:hypothetical protein
VNIPSSDQKINGNLNAELFEAAGVAVTTSVAKIAAPAANSGYRVTVLDDFADEIRAGHEAVQNAMSNALDIALQTGDVLLAARDRISTGWIRWLQDECGINRATAHLYMKLAGKREEIENARAQIHDLSLRGAYRLITKKPPEQLSAPPPIEPAGENLNKSAKPEPSSLDLLLATTPAPEVAVEFAKRDVPWLLERLPKPWIPTLTNRVAKLLPVHDEPFLKASEVLRNALSAMAIADAPKTSSVVALSQEKVALNALRALNVLLAGASIDTVTIMRMHAKENRCVVEKRRGGKRRGRRA